MKLLSNSLIAIGFAALTIGCAIPRASIVGTHEWFEADGMNSLQKRASFDLSCPAEKLNYVGLGGLNGDYVTVGVDGCDKKATYLFVDYSQGWVLNAEND